MRLGVRVELVRRAMPVLPVLVIVPDERSLVAAVGAWSTKARFPVLIDDGTRASREAVARFSRAFKPERTARWQAPDSFAPPANPAEWRRVIDKSAAAAWGDGKVTPGPADLLNRWKSLDHVPPGIVVTHERDDARTAALVLAAARGQPILWLSDQQRTERGLHEQLTIAQADAISEAVRQAAEATGLSWKELGDDLDAVTLCINAPVRVEYQPVGDAWQVPTGNLAMLAPKPGEALALTDVIGRATTGPRNQRWAWAGQIFGSARQANERAMAAVFLQPDSAWFFDGYEPRAPFTNFDPREAGEQTKALGWRTTVIRSAGAVNGTSAADFRRRGAGAMAPGSADSANSNSLGGLDAALIGVNTSGFPEQFDLRPGTCRSGDVPVLARPAIVHFVHSWSAKTPNWRETIAGRWLERGAYAYVGSVHEPFLGGFQPTPMFVRRLLAPSPLGAAARLDAGPPWRITIIGDPLTTIGPALPRAGGELPLDGADDVNARVTQRLRAKDLAGGLADLVVLARDRDAARLVRALLAESADKVTPEMAALALGPVFHDADRATLAKLLDKALPLAKADPAILDFAWHSLGVFGQILTPDEADLLARCIRPDNFVRDADEASAMLKRMRGADAAVGLLERLREQSGDDFHKKELDRIIKNLK